MNMHRLRGRDKVTMKRCCSVLLLLLMLLTIGACAENADKNGGDITEKQTDIGDLSTVESESVVTSEEETEIDKSVWMKELWPEWEDYKWGAWLSGRERKYLEDDYYPFGYGALNGCPEAPSFIMLEELNCTMYAAKQQFIYCNVPGFADEPLVEPYMGYVAGALEKGEAVHVLYSMINQFRPQDGIYYVIDNSIGDPFLDEYVSEMNSPDSGVSGWVRHLQLEEVTDEEEQEADLTNRTIRTRPIDSVSDEMENVWPGWKEYAYTDDDHGICLEEDDGDNRYIVTEVMMLTFYPSEDVEERLVPQQHEKVAISRRNVEDRVMYATQDQFIYEMVLPTKETPLTYPYIGPIVGFIEKGQAVHVKAVLRNKFRPDDGEYYGVAICDEGDGIFFSEYMDPKMERFGKEVLQRNNPVYGYAVYLSETPVA